MTHFFRFAIRIRGKKVFIMVGDMRNDLRARRAMFVASARQSSYSWRDGCWISEMGLR